jgi:hypothetical protein
MHLRIMASLAIARKVTASFSNRVANRRHSSSHATHRSTALRRRHVALSKCGLRRWSFRVGITARMPRRRR